MSPGNDVPQHNGTNGVRVPEWVKIGLYALDRVPFSQLVAVFLLLMWAGVVPSPWSAAFRRQDELIVAVEAQRREQAELKVLFGDLLKAMQLNSATQRRICRNTATNPVDRLACGD